MILVDTSVWVDHLRAGKQGLEELLQGGRVLTHPFIIGELACGNLQNRETVLTLLHELPHSKFATDEEVLFFIDRHRLYGLGIGYIDAHLLASVLLEEAAQLWTRDKRLHASASALGLASRDDSN